jgi:hypothetical protein
MIKKTFTQSPYQLTFCMETFTDHDDDDDDDGTDLLCTDLIL